MKIEEVSKGNWVIFEENYTQIKGISKDKVLLSGPNLKKEIWVRVDRILPIVLDIKLVQTVVPNVYRGGFKEEKYQKAYIGTVVYHTYAPIKYVHQLQNFCMALWQEKLEITLKNLKENNN